MKLGWLIMPLRSCDACGKLHELGEPCPVEQEHRREFLKQRKKHNWASSKTRRGRRNTQSWKRLHLGRRPYCRGCNRRLDWKTARLDHIKPLAHGGKEEFANTQLLCVDCHKAKSQKESHARRGKKQTEMSRLRKNIGVE